MSLTLGDIVPDLRQNATAGPFPLHDGAGESRHPLFSRPWNVTLPCSGEARSVAALRAKSGRREVKIVGRPIDPLDRGDDGPNAAGRDAPLPRLGNCGRLA
jgi:alkyl hydroperoxide reductase subunit AhpC